MGKYVLIGAVLVVFLVFATQQLKTTQTVQANTGAGVANNLLGPLANAIGGAIARSTSSTSSNSSGLTQGAPPTLGSLGTSSDWVYNAGNAPLTTSEQSDVNSFNTQTQSQQEASIFG